MDIRASLTSIKNNNSVPRLALLAKEHNQNGVTYPVTFNNVFYEMRKKISCIWYPLDPYYE